MGAHFNMACVIGRTLFVHAGINKHSIANLDSIGQMARMWLLEGGQVPRPLSDAFNNMLWERRYHEDPSVWSSKDAEKACAELRELLNKHDLDRIVCGHTPRAHGEIEATWDGLVYNIDLPLNQWMQRHSDENADEQSVKVQVLVLDPGEPEPVVLTDYREADPRYFF